MRKTEKLRKLRLNSTILKMEHYGADTAKFAEVLRGKRSTVVIGYIQRDAAKIIDVRAKSEIIIRKEYLYHMDNSGHFTGYGFGPHGHNDKKPLSMADISAIAATIKTASDSTIIERKVVRGRKRIILRQGDGPVVVVEASKNRRSVDLVTAFNANIGYPRHLRKKRNPR